MSRQSLSVTACLLIVASLGALNSRHFAAAAEPERVLLWPAGAPGAVGSEEADQPSLTIYPPPADKANGFALLICPGGGYQHLALDHEGQQIAAWVNSLGGTAFVLRYRLAPRYRHPAPMNDVQRAVRLIRARAQEWKVDPRRVAIIGFSAGGHLASTAATHFDSGQTDASDPIDQQSCRPDLAILCYPVIAMATEYAHAGSRNNLFGPNPDPKLVEKFSNERQVTPQTPPTFLLHTTPDTAVVPENSILFYSALRRAGVPAELHIYSVGPHGVGLAQKLPEVSGWPQQCAAWLQEMGAFQQK